MVDCTLVTSKCRVMGIYGIVNLHENKIYIGSSNNIYRRKINHSSRLRNSKHSNVHLQRAYNKYGSEYFTFILIEKVEDVNILYDREQFWMDYFNSYVDGYNLRPEATWKVNKTTTTYMPHKMSEETKKKISNTLKGHPVSRETRELVSLCRKGKKHSQETKLRISKIQEIPILQLSLDGDIVKEWESATIAQSEGFDRGHIGACCRGKRKTHKGFKWCYKIDYSAIFNA